MQLVLVRHGQSTWNLERRLQGQTMDVPLTDLGLAQAEEAAARVAALVAPGTPVLSSDQLRAVQTAEVVARALGAGVATTPLLREQYLGRMEGCRLDELSAQPVPDGMDISEVCWGGGESVQQVHRRCVALLEAVRTAHPQAAQLVLVSHGDLLRVLLAVLDGRGHRDVEWCELRNGEVLVRQWAASA